VGFAGLRGWVRETARNGMELSPTPSWPRW
jgi:hypothetical protein